MATPAREVKRRVVSDAGSGVHVRARIDQNVRERRIAALGRPVKRGHAVALGIVHVGAVAQELADRLEIPSGGNIGDGGLVSRPGGSEHQEENDRDGIRQQVRDTSGQSAAHRRLLLDGWNGVGREARPHAIVTVRVALWEQKDPLTKC